MGRVAPSPQHFGRGRDAGRLLLPRFGAGGSSLRSPGPALGISSTGESALRTEKQQQQSQRPRAGLLQFRPSAPHHVRGGQTPALLRHGGVASPLVPFMPTGGEGRRTLIARSAVRSGGGGGRECGGSGVADGGGGSSGSSGGGGGGGGGGGSGEASVVGGPWKQDTEVETSQPYSSMLRRLLVSRARLAKQTGWAWWLYAAVECFPWVFLFGALLRFSVTAAVGMALYLTTSYFLGWPCGAAVERALRRRGFDKEGLVVGLVPEVVDMVVSMGIVVGIQTVAVQPLLCALRLV